MPIQTLSLPAGKVLTVTAGDEKAATLYRIDAAGSPGTPTAISSGSTSSVGPFGSPYAYGIDDETGAASFAITTPDPANTTVDQSFSEGVDLALGTTTGSKIGTAIAQKLAFHNSTPVIQRASANQTAVTDSTGGSVADAIAAVVTAPAALTDSTGGTPGTTLAAITTFTPSVAWDGAAVYPSAADATAIGAAITSLKNTVASLATQQEADRLAIISLTNGLAKVIELANELRAALVEKGLIKGSA